MIDYFIRVQRWPKNQDLKFKRIKLDIANPPPSPPPSPDAPSTILFLMACQQSVRRSKNHHSTSKSCDRISAKLSKRKYINRWKELLWRKTFFLELGHSRCKIGLILVQHLAENGIILEQHYVQPKCAPSRAALLTGNLRFVFFSSLSFLRLFSSYLYSYINMVSITGF